MWAAAAALPKFGPPDQRPACLRRAGLFPLRLAQGVERGLLDEFVHRLYGMYLAVLAARTAVGRGDWAGHGDSLFPDRPRPLPRNPFPWNNFVLTPPRGCGPQPATPPARGPAGLEVTRGVGPVGTGAGLDPGFNGTVVG